MDKITGTILLMLQRAARWGLSAHSPHTAAEGSVLSRRGEETAQLANMIGIAVSRPNLRSRPSLVTAATVSGSAVSSLVDEDEVSDCLVTSCMCWI